MNSHRATTHPLADAVRHGIRGSGWALAALSVPGWAVAAPTGGQVVAGSAAIAQQGTKTTITQATAKGAINWQGFSIGTNEYVQFVQPGSTSVTLNRVVGNDPSQLLGQMSANGQIFLVNPSGVYFGANARIDVAGLVATTFDIADDDFMAGRYQFARVEGRDPAQVINDGTITANGGYVVLAGDGVANHGLIEAYLGDIVMAAGERVGLDLSGDGLISFSIDGEALTEIAGVENTGELYADGGRIFLTAKVQGDLLPTAVNHEGLIQARTVEEREGVVYLGGAGGDVTIAGAIDADAGEANAGGGTILVGSNRDITVSDGALITAQGTGSGDGGVVRLVATEILDIEALVTVTATGGETGQGGFIEVSGHRGLNVRGDVDPGSGGRILIDPASLVIVPGAAGSTASSVQYNSTADVTTVHEAYIEGRLNVNQSVILIASNTIGVGSFGPSGSIDATGNGSLALRIGTTSISTPSGSLDTPFFEFGSGCPVGVCIPGGTSGSYAYSRGGINKSISLLGGDGNYVGIDIGGPLSIDPGIQGTVNIKFAKADSIDIKEKIVVTGSDSINPISVHLETVADVLAVEQVYVENFNGAASVDLLGAGGIVTNRVIVRASDSVGSAAIRLDAGSNSIAPYTGSNGYQAMNKNGDASVNLAASNGIQVNGKLEAIAVNGVANINIDAGSGAFSFTGPWIHALDFLPSSTCGYGGTNCFTNGSGGLVLPDFVTGSGAASIVIAGANINILPHFQAALFSPGGLGAYGFVAAMAGDSAAISINATTGDLTLGSSDGGGPLIYAKSGVTDSKTADIFLDAPNGTITVNRAGSPLIEDGLGTQPRNIAILADGRGDNNAALQLRGGNIAIASGAELVSRVDMSGGTLGVVKTAFIDLTGNIVLLDSNLEAFAKNGGGQGQAFVRIWDQSGDLNISREVVTAGSFSNYVELRAAGNVAIGGLVNTNRLRATADSGGVNLVNFIANSVRGTAGNGDFIATSPNDLTLDSAQALNGDIRVTAGGLLTVNPTVRASSTGTLELRGAGIQVNGGGLVVGGQIIINGGTGGDLVQIDGTVINNATSGEAIVRIDGTGVLTIGAGGSVTGHNNNNGVGSATVWIGGSSSFASVNILGNVEADGGGAGVIEQVLIFSQGEIQVTGSVSARNPTLLGSGAHVFLQGSTVNAPGLVKSGVLTVDAPGGVVLGNAEVVTNLLVLSSSGAIDITNTGNLSIVNLNAGGGGVRLFNDGDVTALPGFSIFATTTVDLAATGTMSLLGNINAGGALTITADGQVVLGTLAGNTITAASIDAESFFDQLRVGGILTTTGSMKLVALDNVHIDGDARLTSGGFMLLSAGNMVTSNDGNTPQLIDANSLTAEGVNGVGLSFVDQLFVHNGPAQVGPSGTPIGDPDMLQQLTDLGGTAPLSSTPNAAFISSAGEVKLGNTIFFSDYIYLKADTLTLTQPVSTFLPGSEGSPALHPDVVVQMLPFDPARPIGIEQAPLSSPVAGTTYYTTSGHFGRFPGTSIFTGGTLYTGAANIGTGGIVNVGGQNFLLATGGSVTGAGNIVSTGLIGITGFSPPPTTPPSGPVNTGAVNTVVQQTTSPTDPAGSTIPEETVQSNVPPEEQTGTETTPEGPVDPIAILEQQPLIGGQVEVNNTVLTCQ